MSAGRDGCISRDEAAATLRSGRSGTAIARDGCHDDEWMSWCELRVTCWRRCVWRGGSWLCGWYVGRLPRRQGGGEGGEL